MQSLEQRGKTPMEIHNLVSLKRDRQGVSTPCLKRIRHALRGLTYKRARKETRGRKPKLTRKAVLKMNACRKKMIKHVKGEREVRWDDVRKSSRAQKAHRTTLLRSFKREGIPVEARRPRLKPDRTAQQARDRVDYCKDWGRRRPTFFLNHVDMIIDNKQFDVPTTERARKYLASQRVRFHLRTPGEGTQPEMTKPGRKKNRMNTGAMVKVCAGVSNGRIVMWEYLPRKWNGEEAAKLYKGALLKELKKARGTKKRYLLFEDNDPTGYKSRKGMAAKAEVGIHAVPMPAYSPDLNPLDYFLWDEVDRRMVANTPADVETVAAYKKRLRLTALRLPYRLVAKGVSAMPARMRAIVEAKGHNIKKD